MDVGEQTNAIARVDRLADVVIAECGAQTPCSLSSLVRKQCSSRRAAPQRGGRLARRSGTGTDVCSSALEAPAWARVPDRRRCRSEGSVSPLSRSGKSRLGWSCRVCRRRWRFSRSSRPAHPQLIGSPLQPNLGVSASTARSCSSPARGPGGSHGRLRLWHRVGLVCQPRGTGPEVSNARESGDGEHMGERRARGA